ncbi:hypothetical protein TNCV_725571 [Trichonephila clavipes]|nr:hypothetical protein TNCV_725571 [Trichonephila clavipes]
MVSLRHGDTLNSRRAASLLVRLVEGEERWEALTTPKVFSLKIEVESSQIALYHAWCSKLWLATVTFSPSWRGVRTDIPSTHRLSGVSNPKRNKSNKSFL